MPVLLFLFGQLAVQLLRDDVLDAVQVRGCGISVEQGALREVFIHLMAEVVRLHLVRRVVLDGVKAHQVDVELFRRRIGLNDGCTRFQGACGSRFLRSGRGGGVDRLFGGCGGTAGKQQHKKQRSHRYLSLVIGCVRSALIWVFKRRPITAVAGNARAERAAALAALAGLSNKPAELFSRTRSARAPFNPSARHAPGRCRPRPARETLRWARKPAG
jgi:hypothetical protein